MQVVFHEGVLSACLGLYGCARVGGLFPGLLYPHGLPVVGKLLAAVQTNDIRAGRCGGPSSALSPSAGDGEAHALVPASEQCIENCHLLLQNLCRKRLFLK